MHACFDQSLIKPREFAPFYGPEPGKMSPPPGSIRMEGSASRHVASL